MKKSIIKVLVFAIVCFTVSLNASAQLGAECIDGLDPSCDPITPCPCPIDNGVLLLIGFAVLIAFKKAYDYKKQTALS